MTGLDQYAILDSIGECALIIDQEYKIVFANQHFFDLCGTGREAILGKKCHEILHGSPFPCAGESGLVEECIHQRVFATGQPFTVSDRHTMPDGSKRFLQITASPLKDKNGSTIRLISLIKDITERRRDELALRKSEARYAALFNNNHTVMMLIDPETADILAANPAARAFYGYSKEEFQGLKISDINTLSREQVGEILRRIITAGPGDFIFQHRLKSGEVRDVEVFSRPPAAGGAPGFMFNNS